MTEEDYNYTLVGIRELLGSDDAYLDVFVDQGIYTDEIQTAYISEGLADIYQELKDMAAAFQTGEETIMHKRETLSGHVSFKSKYISIPFERMRVYATSSPKIADSKSRIIGKVNEDGTYSVVKPDGITPLYVYVTGEKDNAHFVAEGTTTLDIIIKTNK